MDGWLIHTALTLIGITLLYAILARGLLYASEPQRAKCLSLYEKMVKSHRASPEFVARLDEFLDDVYSSWAAWRLAMLTICAVFFLLPIRKLLGRTSPPSSYKGVPDSLQQDFGRFMSCWLLATISNSPAAALIFVFALLIGIGFFVPFHVIAKLLSSHSLDHKHAH
jgi:hypothetical protein